MVDRRTALQLIDDAFRQEGFHPDPTRAPSNVYRGVLRCANIDIAVSCEVVDTNFVEFPRIRIDDGATLPDRVLPHVYGDGTNLCYLERTTAILDRYNPAGTIVYCLRRAQKTLEDAIRGTSDVDFADEFAAYWGGDALVDLPKEFDRGDATVYWLSLDERNPEHRSAVVARPDRLATALSARHDRIANSVRPVTEPCATIKVEVPLTVDSKLGEWPPSNIKSLVKWLKPYVNDIEEQLSTTYLKGQGKHWWVMLRAPNGCFLACIVLPNAYQKVEFTQSRRTALPEILSIIGDTVSVRRFTGFPMDRDYLFGRNLHSMKSLMDKKILLIGCGTIGGFLSQYLAQSGAGAGDRGELCLVDDDSLLTANLGRHLLGVPYLERNKAEACRDFLCENIPHVRVVAHPVNALVMVERMVGYDLVIDAAGEEALSIAINEFAVRHRPAFPPTLFVWLVGNGAAAQAIFCGEKDKACYKCLKTDFQKPPRYRVERVDTERVRNLSCGDAAYVPFPVSRSVQAASLALEMALDWVNGRVGRHFRTRVFDEDRAFHVKDGNPAPSPDCPACRIP